MLICGATLPSEAKVVIHPNNDLHAEHVTIEELRLISAATFGTIRLTAIGSSNRAPS
jgi:hypothetical protein